MKNKILNLFKTKFFKKCFNIIFDLLLSFGFCFVFVGILINCIYIALNLVNLYAMPSDMINVFKDFLFFS